ncbi:MAG: response regulator [Oscillatoriophycideae cyanobacterium NC_groundwater_1537_Pr4_S-0.65um_50_18]|nr:response regulator [Oscillatoriophycideae cyanobacterium NC_groundwater_1537_Pr4_S-0.65um_50_18]
MFKRVLIIDDDLGIRKITQISLKAIAGWEVLVAASGQEGIAIAQTEAIDAILLDVMMPGMDGITTLEYLQTNPSTQIIPVILLTAKAQVFEQQQLTELPVTGIITKPFKAPELVKQMCLLLKWNPSA